MPSVAILATLLLCTRVHFFEEYNVDALTVAPYMGEDSVKPFLGYPGKWVILLALTSNKGSHDFQLTTDTEGERLFEKVIRTSQQWGNEEDMMYVVGATGGYVCRHPQGGAPPFLLVRVWARRVEACRRSASMA